MELDELLDPVQPNHSIIFQVLIDINITQFNTLCLDLAVSSCKSRADNQNPLASNLNCWQIRS